MMTDLGLVWNPPDYPNDSVAMYSDLRSRGIDRQYPAQMLSIATAISGRNYGVAYSQLAALIGTLYHQTPAQRLAIIRSQIPRTVPGPAVSPVPWGYQHSYENDRTEVRDPSGNVVFSTPTSLPQALDPMSFLSPGEQEAGNAGILAAVAVLGGLIWFMSKNKKTGQARKTASKRRR